MAEMAALMGGLLNIIHRDQYLAGLQVRDAVLVRYPHVRPFLQPWVSTFTCIKVISNSTLR